MWVVRRPLRKVKLKCLEVVTVKYWAKKHIYIMCPIVAKGYTSEHVVWKLESEAVKSIRTQVKNI